jgi:hypothetical protein
VTKRSGQDTAAVSPTTTLALVALLKSPQLEGAQGPLALGGSFLQQIDRSQRRLLCFGPLPVALVRCLALLGLNLVAVTVLAITFLRAPGGIGATADMMTKLVTNILRTVGEAKMAEDELRRLPLPEITGPRKGDSGPCEELTQPSWTMRYRSNRSPIVDTPASGMRIEAGTPRPGCVHVYD